MTVFVVGELCVLGESQRHSLLISVDERGRCGFDRA